MEYKKVKLGELVEITSSKRIFAKEYLNEGIPFYRGKEIIEKFNNQEISQKIFISEDKYLEIKNKFGVPQKGDLLLTAVGTIGVPYIVKDEKFYFKDGNLAWFKNFNGINSFYLYYWLLSSKGKQEIKKRLIGSSQQALTISELKEFNIKVPPLFIQEKIVYILERLDNKIEINNKIISNLEKIAQTIFKFWFVDFEPFKDGKFIESELGLIPEGWEVRKLKNDLDFIRGLEPGSKNYKNVKSKKDINFYRVGDMLTITETYIDKELAKGKLVKEEDVLVSFDGTVGRVAVGLNGAYSSGIRNIKEKKNKYYPKSFIYVLFNSKNIQDLIKQHATGTTILHAGKSIDYMQIPYNKEIVEKITKILDSMYNQLLNLKFQNKRLEEIRNTLLPRLMNGKINLEKININI